MDFNHNKPNLCWTYNETTTLLRNMRNYQLLWIPYIFKKEEYQTAIKFAQRRLVTLTKRPWKDISLCLKKLRMQFKLGRSWHNYAEMKLSLTVDGDKR